MQVGVNWLSPYTLPLVQQFLAEGVADFCEVMLDNVIHLSPKQVRAVLPDTPICFHIVTSRFLEKTSSELAQMAEYVKRWIDELEPFYISDHLTSHVMENGRRHAQAQEINYATHFDDVCEKIVKWQDMLGVSLLLENNASTTAYGAEQAYWYARILQETNARLLFDVSNAYLAACNDIAAYNSWLTLLPATKHFHVAGYRFDPLSGLWQDTHDVSISAEVYDCLQLLPKNQNQTIVLEFDSQVDGQMWKAELVKMRRSLGTVG